MRNSVSDKVIFALKQAAQHNRSVMTRPEVILWPDPERQWEPVLLQLQELLPQILVYGSFNPDKKTGPAIWLKAMLARRLPGADWPEQSIPIIYLPGIAKIDLRNVENAVFNLQPLLEYQYTGVIFLQENGKEWTIRAFLENPLYGLGIKVSADNATREALKKSLPLYFQDTEIFQGKSLVDAAFLNNLVFPNIGSAILSWMSDAEVYDKLLDPAKREAFASICKSDYDFEPDPRHMKMIAEKLGGQRGGWKTVWDLYAAAPGKYPRIADWLRLAKPDDLGTGMYAVPEESWPQLNEQKEKNLLDELGNLIKMEVPKAIKKLQELEMINAPRRGWVWHELGQSPLAAAVKELAEMAHRIEEPYTFQTLEELREYYITRGYLIDQAMRKAYACVKTTRDKETVAAVIGFLYTPWLETLALRFQKKVENDPGIFLSPTPCEDIDTFILFVDAFRYELAQEFMDHLVKAGWKVKCTSAWSALPSVTPTAKPAVAPLSKEISTASTPDEFGPQTLARKALTTPVFRELLTKTGYNYIGSAKEIMPSTKYWQETGEIDSKGHAEGADMVHRIQDLFDQVMDIINAAFDKGIRRIRVVTDHGWLLLPGGLPKTKLNAGLTETRWGRCALMKDGAPTNLVHLPWRWNLSVYIAYAPGISYFKANVDYAHGGVSLQECLVPVLTLEKNVSDTVQATIIAEKWVGLKCTISTSTIPDNYKADIRLKYTDAASSILEGKPKYIQNSTVTLMVKDDFEDQAATLVLMDENEMILDTKLTTVGGK